MSIPLAMFTAIPAGAAATCQTSINPNQASAQSGLKVGCIIDVSATPTANANHIEVHDGTNATWHRGAARTVTVNTTNTSKAITFATGTMAGTDLRRPISGVGIGGGAFIQTLTPAACTLATCTGGTLSVASTATGATTATIEHTGRVSSRTRITRPVRRAPSRRRAAVFTAADLRKSVSGGSFNNGARISAVTNATTVTVSGGATLAHAAADDTITIGAVTYAAAGAGLALAYTETWNRQLNKTPAPGTASCAGSTITNTAAGGGFVASDVNLKVFFFDSTGAAVAGTWKINSNTATTAVLSAPCPAAAAWSSVVIGQPGADAPANGATMASLVASLNLNPALVADQDDCNKNTYEGFAVIGAWNNPGSFTTGVLGAAPNRSIAQILFPTAVVSFAGYIVPKTAAEAPAHQVTPHYDFVFPLLPTTLAVCTPGAGVTTLKTAITLGFASSTLTTPPALATGSGNPTSPVTRQIGPSTGLFGEKVSLYNGTTQLGADVAPAGCTVIARTAVPTFGCGLG